MTDQLIQTERLLLRPFTEGDVDALYLLDSDPQVMKYLGNKVVQNIEESATYLHSILQQYIDNGIGRWAVIEKESDQLIGWSGIKWIKEDPNGVKNIYDLGYRLRPQFWGKGYATESSLAWISYAKEHLAIKTLYATAHKDNLASQKVLAKCGFEIKKNITYHLNGEDLPCVWLEMAI